MLQNIEFGKNKNYHSVLHGSPSEIASSSLFHGRFFLMIEQFFDINSNSNLNYGMSGKDYQVINLKAEGIPVCWQSKSKQCFFMIQFCLAVSSLLTRRSSGYTVVRCNHLDWGTPLGSVYTCGPTHPREKIRT